MAFSRGKPYSDKPKRIRKRKARTDVSSSSSSSDTDSSDSDPKSEKEAHVAEKVTSKKSKTSKQPRKVNDRAGQETSPEETPEPEAAALSTIEKQANADAAAAEETFTSFYLKQITTEFAEDLDKVRSAGDFNNRSIGMLVDALKQGTSCFDKQERLSVGKSVAM